MKILHIVIRTSYDGAMILPFRIIKNIPEYDHYVVSCYRGSAAQELENNGINLTHLLQTNSIKNKSIKKISSFIIFLFKNNYDVIHYHCGGLSLLFISYLLKRNAKIIHHIHTKNITGKVGQSVPPLWVKVILRQMRCKITEVASSKNAIEYYKKHISFEYTPRLLENFTPYDFSSRKKLYGAVGYIGRVEREKGIDKFIEIINDEYFISNKLLIRIKGDISHYYKETLSQISNYENVQILEPGLGIKSFLTQIDLMFFASYAPETLPLVILEAISLDVGIIMQRSKLSSEVLGSYPLLIDDWNTDEISKVISKYYSSESLRGQLTEYHRKLNQKYEGSHYFNNLKKIYNG